jgi:hypothetical protein
MTPSFCFSKVVETYLAEILTTFPSLEKNYYPGFQIMLTIFRVVFSYSGDIKQAYENTVHAGQLYIEYMKQEQSQNRKDSGYVTFIYEKILAPLDLFSGRRVAADLPPETAEEISRLGAKCNDIFEWSRGGEITLEERLRRAPLLYKDGKTFAA